ncbi:hypothetical protein FXF51_06255 [Nonomuraea sp. PA05]|uniref:hypothetical protein n=1 Tax=Nonomuraea sp. PA05 TaxID=2604466 RepID=UPI0011DA6DD6|nr:hypothetical protein [Nonomuraea sp. PA05]TYB69763.1 hypothetical protein FXF51_06255 [Nonomuraea sp. PA05]
MADREVPSDLLELKKEFLKAEAECERISRALPSSVDVVALEAERDTELEQQLNEARAWRLKLVDAIYRRPAMAKGAEDRLRTSLGLTQAAKDALAAEAGDGSPPP